MVSFALILFNALMLGEGIQKLFVAKSSLMYQNREFFFDEIFEIEVF